MVNSDGTDSDSLDSDKVVTRGGSNILRHHQRERSFESPDCANSVAEEVEAHFESQGLQVDSVFHEIVSDLVHLDVHVVAPSKARPFFTLFTTGMADRPMAVPPQAESLALAELMLCLPASWPLAESELRNETNYWPIRLLKSLARLPHEYQTWLGIGHTVPNGDPAQAYAEGTELAGALIAPPLTLEASAHRFQSSQGPVNIYSVVPLYDQEMNLKLAQGTDALLDKLDEHAVSELLDPKRKPVTRRKLFRIF